MGQARDAERRARKAALAEQAAKGEEREALNRQKNAHVARCGEAAESLDAELERHCNQIALRCDHALPRPEARECREALAAMRSLVAEHHVVAYEEDAAHDKACGVLQQVDNVAWTTTRVAPAASGCTHAHVLRTSCATRTCAGQP